MTEHSCERLLRPSVGGRATTREVERTSEGRRRTSAQGEVRRTEPNVKVGYEILPEKEVRRTEPNVKEGYEILPEKRRRSHVEET